jgi:FkbM family methyltransferase
VLAANVALADRLDAVTLVREAAGAGDHPLPLLLESAAGGFQFIRPLETRVDAANVEATTIDALVDRTGLLPTHVKIDVEGCEDDVLTGGAGCLRSCHPIVLLELHGQLLRAAGRRPEDVLDQLAGLGYDDLSWRGRPVPPAQAAAMWVSRLVCR